MPPLNEDETAQKRNQLTQALSDIAAERRRLVHGYVTLAAIPEDDFEKRSKALSARETALLTEMEKLGDVETEQNRRRSSMERLNRVRDEAGEKMIHLRNDEEPQAVRSWLHTWLRLKVDREDGENRVVEIVIF